jgi:HAD superfamily hydrolase (TIGR01549 family)
MIKAVIFDVDGVLIDSFAANLKFYQDLMTSAGYNPPTKKDFTKMFYMTMRDVIKTVTKSNDENKIKKIWLMGKNREVRYPDELLITPDKYESIIEKLWKNYNLAIVTSRIQGGVFKLPQLIKLKNKFKTTVYFEDTKKHKPDPEPLLLAASRLNLKPEEAVYVGDAESDIKAAKSANMKIIIYSKKRLPGADAVTDSFDKLPSLIKSLN